MADTPGFIETIVISTRIRLARNFASYPFPKRMDDAQAEDIVYLVGDGYEVAKKQLSALGIPLASTPYGLRSQSAASCCFVAKRMLEEGKTTCDRSISPSYLRLPQAERERLERQEQSKK